MPNYLVDRLLPGLKDTELRVLLVLIRQTTGWNREGQAVILSYRVLMSRTGRKSEAVSKALQGLAVKRLIHVSVAFKQYPHRKARQSSSETELQQYKDK